MLSEFFSKDLGEPAGIFSIEHLIFLGICLVLIFLALLATKNLNPKKIDRIILIIAILVTLLEIAKIVWNYQAGRRSKGVLYPLYYCSIFIYAALLAGFGKRKVKEAGYAFLAYGGLLAGPAFLVYPVTSLAFIKLFHFLSFHSMIYHSLMFYVGLLLLVRGYKITKSGVIGYFVLTFLCCLLAFVINKIDGSSNLMFIMKPIASFKPLVWVYNFNYKLYPLFFSVLQNFGIWYVSKFIYILAGKLKESLINYDQKV